MLTSLLEKLKAALFSAHGVDLVLTYVGSLLTLVLTHTSTAANGTALSAVITALLGLTKLLQTNYSQNPPKG